MCPLTLAQPEDSDSRVLSSKQAYIIKDKDTHTNKDRTKVRGLAWELHELWWLHHLNCSDAREAAAHTETISEIIHENRI